MSRYTGPRLRVMRALGIHLPGLSSKAPERRPYPPGQHGQSRMKKPSDYRMQLMEKQKLRYNYGISERQFRRYMIMAKKSKTNTGEKLLELLERRLDNVLFRAGFAATIPAARQLVSHGHVNVNGKRVDVSSYTIGQDDVVDLREKSRKFQIVKDALADAANIARRPQWLEVNAEQFSAKMTALPGAESVLFPVEAKMVVEYYAKRL